MLHKLKDTAKHTSIIALGKISSKLVGFILLPIYTKEISVADYGVLGLLEVIELVGIQVFSIGLHQALLRWYSLTQNFEEKKKILFTTFIFIFLIGLFSVSIVIPNRHLISYFLFATDIYGEFLIYSFISIFFLNITRISQTILRVEEKTAIYSISVLLQFCVSLVLNIYFVANLKMGVRGVLIAQAISSGLLFLILLPYLFKRMTMRININQLVKMIEFGYPFIFIAIYATILNLGDRYLLTKLSSLAEVGLYSLGYKFSNILKIFLVDSFALGLPIIGWQMVRDQKQPKRFFSKALTYFVLALLWFGLILSVYAKGIIHFFALNKAYWDAYLVVPYLVLGVVFYGMQQNFYFILQIPQKTKNISVILFTSALLNVLLNYFLIPLYGMMAAAVVTVISQFWAMTFAYLQVQKYYPLQFEIRRILLMFLVAGFLYFFTMFFNDFILIWRIVLKFIVILTFPIILYLLKFFETTELVNIKKVIYKIFHFK